MPRPNDECECHIEHSVGKLGHSHDCPWHRDTQPTMIQRGLLTAHACPPVHVDGTPHDFNWATCSEARMSYGVCRCGLDALSHDLLHAE